MFIAAKYKNRWAVLDTFTNVYYFMSKGRRACEQKAKELNNCLK